MFRKSLPNITTTLRKFSNTSNSNSPLLESWKTIPSSSKNNAFNLYNIEKDFEYKFKLLNKEEQQRITTLAHIDHSNQNKKCLGAVVTMIIFGVIMHYACHDDYDE